MFSGYAKELRQSSMAECCGKKSCGSKKHLLQVLHGGGIWVCDSALKVGKRCLLASLEDFHEHSIRHYIELCLYSYKGLSTRHDILMYHRPVHYNTSDRGSGFWILAPLLTSRYFRTLSYERTSGGAVAKAAACRGHGPSALSLPPHVRILYVSRAALPKSHGGKKRMCD